MIPTTEQILETARAHLADVESATGEEFTDEVLLPLARNAWADLMAKAKLNSVPPIEKTVTVSIDAGDTFIDMVALGNTDFGIPLKVYNVTDGRLTDVDFKNELIPDLDSPVGRLSQVEFTGDVIVFNPASETTTLKIKYLASGALPDTGSCGLDDVLSYMAHKTAAYALYPREGTLSLARSLDSRAGEALTDWISIQIKQTQSATIARPKFGTRRR